jgi:ABC-type Fe3+-hydroxamate transport system substrate-binding protein
VTIRVTDDLGVELEVPDVPARIVSLVPSLSETLWWLHVADRVVGVTDHCVAPPHGFPAAERVRGTKNPDVAAIVDLAPDVVLANQEENRRLDVERLRDAGIAVYVTAPTSVPDAARMLADVGALVGAPKAGEGLAQSIERALEIKRADERAPLTAFVPVWRDPWMATGTATYAADLLRWCGFEVVPDAPRYPEVALDDVRDLDPDVVLLPDEPYAFGDADRRVFADWRARVRRIDGTQLTWYGPRTAYAIGELTRLNRAIRRRLARR